MVLLAWDNLRKFFAAMNVADSQSSIETPTMTILAPLIDILKLHIQNKDSFNVLFSNLSHLSGNSRQWWDCQWHTFWSGANNVPRVVCLTSKVTHIHTHHTTYHKWFRHNFSTQSVLLRFVFWVMVRKRDAKPGLSLTLFISLFSSCKCLFWKPSDLVPCCGILFWYVLISFF